MNGMPQTSPPQSPDAPRGAYTPPVSMSAGDPRRKSPALASVLSLIPGLGQVYVGYYQRGFVHAIVTALVIAMLGNVGSGQEATFIPLGVIFVVFFWLYNIIDAGRKASLLNLALEGHEQIELPSDFKMPELARIGGSIPGGLALLAIGGILLSHTRYGYSLDWVRQWWPAALMLVGVWLVILAIQDRLRTGHGEDA